MRQREMLRRVIVEAVTPQVDEGRYPAKRTFGEDVIVEADVYADGHDVVAAMLLWRRQGETDWDETPMRSNSGRKSRAPIPGTRGCAVVTPLRS